MRIPSCRRIAAAAFVAALAGCSANSMAPGNVSTNANGTTPSGTPAQLRALADGHGVRPATHARSHGWMSPDAATDKNAIFWGSYDNSTITIYSAKGKNGKQLGQITEGLSNPERLFVDK